MNGFWATYTHDLAHRHVLFAYGAAWILQLSYLFFVLRRRQAVGKTETQSPGTSD